MEETKGDVKREKEHQAFQDEKKINSGSCGLFLSSFILEYGLFIVKIIKF